MLNTTKKSPNDTTDDEAGACEDCGQPVPEAETPRRWTRPLGEWLMRAAIAITVTALIVTICVGLVGGLVLYFVLK